MRIAILGTGRMASGLGRGWLNAGHFIAFGSRRPETKNDFQAEVGADCRVYGFEGAITAGEVVVIAVPYAEVVPLVSKHADLLRGKIVIDITNPFAAQPADGRAGAELTAAAIGEGARVLAAFKGNFSSTLEEPVDHTGQPRDVLFTGDDAEAKQVLTGLIQDLGFTPVDCGPLHSAVMLDLSVPMLIEMDGRLNGGQHNSSLRYSYPGDK
jgi:predicted dinucleotide-binding enzyme